VGKANYCPGMGLGYLYLTIRAIVTQPQDQRIKKNLSYFQILYTRLKQRLFGGIKLIRYSSAGVGVMRTDQ